jgi:hypothetical protein
MWPPYRRRAYADERGGRAAKLLTRDEVRRIAETPAEIVIAADSCTASLDGDITNELQHSIFGRLYESTAWPRCVTPPGGAYLLPVPYGRELR